MKYLSLFIIPFALLGDNCSSTLCTLTYTPPDSDPCYISGIDNSGLISSINDLNPSIFAGADNDLQRTYANGFKPTILLGNRRQVFVGSDVGGMSRKGTDGVWYSTSLQATTRHTFTISCSGGAVVNSIDLTTSTGPIGNYYPELPILDSTAPMGQVAIPTFQWDRTTSYPADNGVLVHNITLPMDAPEEQTRELFSRAFDLTSAWTSPQNAITNQASGTLATTSTQNAPLFLSWSNTGLPEPNAQNWIGATSKWPTDIKVSLYGNGTGVVSTCISFDSGQTCASPSILQTYTGSNVVMNIPSGYPSNYFKSWGVSPTSLNPHDLVNQTFGGVTVSGNIITLPNPTGNSPPNLNRASGSKFQLSSCGGLNGFYTYASIDSFTQITSVESIGSASGCAFTDASAGIRITLVSPGTVNLSASYTSMMTFPAQANNTPNYDMCSLNKVTDIATDCDGNTQSPNLTGRLCQIGNNNGANRSGIYLIQDNGRVCLQSMAYVPSTDYIIAMPSPWDISNPKKLAGRIGNQLYTIEKTTTNYTEYIPGSTVPPASDGWTYTAITPATTLFDSNPSNPSQLKNLCGPSGTNATNCSEVWRHYTSGQWSVPNLAAASGGYPIWISGPNNNGGIEFPFLKFRTDLTGTLIQSTTTFDKPPYRWCNQHSTPQGVGSLLAETCSVANSFGAGITGPHVVEITQIHRPTGFQSYTLPVTSCTSANPIVCTTSSEHHLDQYVVGNNGLSRGRGNLITATGCTGGWATFNGKWLAVAVGNTNGNVSGSTTTFNVYNPISYVALDSSGFGSYAGCTITTTPPIGNFSIFSISGNNPPTLTLNQVAVGTELYTADHMWQDGYPVGIDNYRTTQFYVRRVSGTQVQLYLDQALTSPVDTLTYTNLGGKGIYYAEACPNSLPTIPFDSWGTTGQVRCIQVNIVGEPCSYLATSGEATAYPCSTDPSNTGKMQLQTLIVGDAIGDVARGSFTENMRVMARSSNTLTLARFAGIDISPRLPTQKPAQNIHEVGWMPAMRGTNLVDNTTSTAYIDATDATATPCLVTSLTTDHTDFGYWLGGLYIYTGSNGYTGTQDDPIIGISPSVFCNQLAIRSHFNPQWMNYQGKQTIGYTSSRHTTGGWVADWFNNIGSFGGDANGVGSPYYSHTVTLVGGTTHIYKVTRASGETFNPKIVPTYTTAAPIVLIDKSAVSSTITDSDINKYCVAYNVNECISGSAVGDTYLWLKNDIGISTPFQCSNNTLNIPTICSFQLAGLNSYMIQETVNPFDKAARQYRGLTRGFIAPGWSYSFQHYTVTPDAKWLFYASTGLNGAGQHYMIAQIPPLPAADSIDRTRYTPYTLQLTGRSGDAVRVAFGYGQNGDPATSLYCMSRLEGCFTSSAASDSNPFLWASESQSRTTCTSSCAVTIPAISGRTLYYRVYRQNGASEVVGQLQAALIP